MTRLVACKMVRDERLTRIGREKKKRHRRSCPEALLLLASLLCGLCSTHDGAGGIGAPL